MIHDINRTIHEPARLLLLIYLYSVEKADFTFLRRETGMTQGNLASHLNKLEADGYVITKKLFRNKRPLTIIHITSKGKTAFREYVQGMHLYFSDLMKLVK